MLENLTFSASYWNGSRALNKRMNGRERIRGFISFLFHFLIIAVCFHSLQQELCYCLKSSYCLSQCRLGCFFLQIFHGNTENIITVKRVNAFSETRQMCHSNVPKRSVACLIYRWVVDTFLNLQAFTGLRKMRNIPPINICMKSIPRLFLFADRTCWF